MPAAPKDVFKTSSTVAWSRERLEQLSRQDIEQLRANAERLGAEAVLALCDQALKDRPRNGARSRAGSPALKSRQHFVSRTKAFESRGVFLRDAQSWGGVRKSDGTVVMSLWASAVQRTEGGCRYLLWAPNLGGARPWSDMPAGQERLEHCRLALEQGGAEGLLVHGDAAEGRLPEERARSVHGVDPEVLVRFQVERHGDEYWAVWGGKSAPAAL